MDWRDIEALVDLIDRLASEKGGVEAILERAAVSLSRRDMLRLCHLIDARQAGNVDHRRIDALVERIDALVELMPHGPVNWLHTCHGFLRPKRQIRETGEFPYDN